MDQNGASIKTKSYMTRRGRPGERGTTATKTIRGLSTTTLQHLDCLWRMGLSNGDSIDAAMDLLMLDLTKNGELCGEYRVKDNFVVQTGPVEDPDAGQTVLRMKRYLQRQKELQDYILDAVQHDQAKVRAKELTPTTRLTRNKSRRQARAGSRRSRRQRSETVPPLRGRHKSG